MKTQSRIRLAQIVGIQQSPRKFYNHQLCYSRSRTLNTLIIAENIPSQILNYQMNERIIKATSVNILKRNRFMWTITKLMFALFGPAHRVQATRAMQNTCRINYKGDVIISNVHLYDALVYSFRHDRTKGPLEISRQILDNIRQELPSVLIEVRIYSILLERAIKFSCQRHVRKFYTDIKENHIVGRDLLSKFLQLHLMYHDIYGALLAFSIFYNKDSKYDECHAKILEIWASSHDPLSSSILCNQPQFASMDKCISTIITGLFKSDNIKAAHNYAEKSDIKLHVHFIINWIEKFAGSLVCESSAVIRFIEYLKESDDLINLDKVSLVLLKYATRTKDQATYATVLKEYRTFEKLPMEQICIATSYLADGKNSQAESLFEKCFEKMDGENLESCYSKVIIAYLEMKDIKNANRYYKHMILQSNFCSTNSVLLRYFLAYYIDLGNYASGLKQYKSMIRDGAVPDDKVFELLMFISQYNSESLMRYWKEALNYRQSIPAPEFYGTRLRENGISVNCIELMINFHLRVFDIKGAELMVQSLPSHHRSTFIAKAMLLFKSNEFNSMNQVFVDMETFGHTPCASTFGLQLQACRKLGDIDMLEEVVQRMTEEIIDLTFNHFHEIVSAYAEFNHFKKAMVWMEVMKLQGFGKFYTISRLKGKIRYRMGLAGIHTFVQDLEKVQNSKNLQNVYPRLTLKQLLFGSQ